VLGMAEVAGITAAKNTSAILPLCHPLPLDAVRVSCTVRPESGTILVRCEAICSGKTGVEMEALTGVSAALLSIYDLTKGVDPALEIGDVRLRVKEGGKSGRWVHPNVHDEDGAVPAGASGAEPVAPPLSGLSAAVLTVSDRCSSGDADDASGRLLAALLRDRGAEVASAAIVPDEVAAIRAAVQAAVDRGAHVVVTTGGTGLGPRDVTPEALRPLFATEIPGIGELLRSAGAASTRMSWLSRSTAGIVGGCLVVALPGSPRAVQEGFDAIAPLLGHAVQIVHGGRSHPGAAR
jgi:cyclic pyranopterin monophosphate synthase